MPCRQDPPTKKPFSLDDWHARWLVTNEKALAELTPGLLPSSSDHGVKTYTVRSKNSASVQINVVTWKFRIATFAPGTAESKRTASWRSMGGCHKAWEHVVTASGWDERKS